VQVDSFQAVLTHDSFVAMGTENTVLVADAAAMQAAMTMVRNQIEAIDRTCSRFRPDSELTRLNRRAGQGKVPLSGLLEEAILAALAAAEMTDGLVDLTVGRCIEEAGYSVTFRDLPDDGPPVQLEVRKVIGWEALRYDPADHTLSLPEGVGLDLGAAGKAWAADRCAGAVFDALGVPVAVNCGGDIAFRGSAPTGGWPVRVALDEDSDQFQDIVAFDGGLATSGTTSRRWRRGGVELHHIIDPSTGLPAQTPWVMVSVAAATCMEANAAATAALIMGRDASQWLEQRHLPARLVDSVGGVTYAGGWTA
jgi:thiamine biosynthesis lipoprotein ApbE